MYYFFLCKRWAEDLAMLPLIWLGRLIALLRPLEEPYDYFFFFPFYSIGGAEKVHAQITQVLAGKKGIIFFTRISKDNQFLPLFEASGFCIKDISKHTDNKWIYPANIIYRGIVSGYIRQQKTAPIVFNGQCNFGYKISPWINRRVKQVELIHSFNSFAWIRIPFLAFYQKQIMISHQTIKDYLDQYRKLKAPKKLSNAITYIQNGIELPKQVATKNVYNELTVLYVGRGTSEKRVHLVANIAKALKDKKVPVSVELVGDVKETIPPELRSYVHFLGSISDPVLLAQVYSRSHVLIITSVFEGFPMVVMEAMAHGLAIVSTNVGDLPYHVKDGTNGFLINETEENDIVTQSTAAIQKLTDKSDLLLAMSESNRNYAIKHFGMNAFNNAYLRLFESMQHE